VQAPKPSSLKKLKLPKTKTIIPRIAKIKFVEEKVNGEHQKVKKSPSS